MAPNGEKILAPSFLVNKPWSNGAPLSPSLCSPWVFNEIIGALQMWPRYWFPECWFQPPGPDSSVRTWLSLRGPLARTSPGERLKSSSLSRKRMKTTQYSFERVRSCQKPRNKYGFCPKRSVMWSFQFVRREQFDRVRFRQFTTNGVSRPDKASLVSTFYIISFVLGLWD